MTRFGERCTHTRDSKDIRGKRRKFLRVICPCDSRAFTCILPAPLSLLPTTMAAVLWASWYSVKFLNSLHWVAHEFLYLIFNTSFLLSFFFHFFVLHVKVKCKLPQSFSSFRQSIFISKKFIF